VTLLDIWQPMLVEVPGVFFSASLLAALTGQSRRAVLMRKHVFVFKPILKIEGSRRDSNSVKLLTCVSNLSFQRYIILLATGR